MKKITVLLAGLLMSYFANAKKFTEIKVSDSTSLALEHQLKEIDSITLILVNKNIYEKNHKVIFSEKLVYSTKDVEIRHESFKNGHRYFIFVNNKMFASGYNDGSWQASFCDLFYYENKTMSFKKKKHTDKQAQEFYAKSCEFLDYLKKELLKY